MMMKHLLNLDFNKKNIKKNIVNNKRMALWNKFLIKVGLKEEPVENTKFKDNMKKAAAAAGAAGGVMVGVYNLNPETKRYVYEKIVAAGMDTGKVLAKAAAVAGKGAAKAAGVATQAAKDAAKAALKKMSKK